MLSTACNNYLQQTHYQKTLEKQNDIETRSRQNAGSENYKLSEFSYFDRKMKIHMNAQIQMNEVYITRNEHQITSFNAMKDCVDHIKDEAGKFQLIIEKCEHNNENYDDSIPLVKNIFTSVCEHLNKQWNDRYLFAGGFGGEKAVDEGFLNTDIDIKSREYNYSYYQGSHDDIELHLTQNTKTLFGINARNENFAFLLNSLNAFINKQINAENISNVKRGLKASIENYAQISIDIDITNNRINAAINNLSEENKIFSDIMSKNDVMEQAVIFSELEQVSQNLKESIEMNKQIANSRKMHEQ